MNKDLPIVYVLDASIAITGAFTSACDASQTLKGVTRTVLVLPEHHAIPAQQLADFWRIETIPMVTLSKNLRSVVCYLPALIAGAWKLRRLMRRDGATRLQLNDFYLMHGALLRLLGYRGHIATWIRCVPARFVGPLARPMLALSHASSNRMIAVSGFIQSLVAEQVASEVIYDCYSGTSRPARIWGMQEEKIFVCIGNYIDGKGQDVALEAFAIAHTTDPTLRLHFYGSDMGLQKNRAYRSRLEKRARTLGVIDSVTFGSFVADTYSVLADAYAALNCSVSESFSRTVLEASGFGIPVISTASGGPQEIIKEGVTGYLVPVGDVAAIVERMLLLARDPAAAAQMGHAGAEHIRTHFSRATLRDKLIPALSL